MNDRLDLQRWLSSATRGLPASIKSLICQELAAHYEDAFDEQCDSGLLPGDAHRAALAQLGDPVTTRRALRRVHLARQRYRPAAWASAASLILVIVGALFSFQPLLFTLMGIGFAYYLIDALRSLVETPHTGPRIGFAVTLIIAGFLVTTVTGGLGLFDAHDYPIAIILIDPLVLTRPDLYFQPLTVVHVTLALGITLIGFGWLILGERLGELGRISFRAMGLLRSAIIVDSLALVGLGLGVLLRDASIIHPVSLFVACAGLSRQVILTRVFMHAAKPSSNIPWRGSHA
ncbi:MAG: hypothetical protein IH587_05380 [Anaerolineae bacterium]|nr:hypothetical protein [Anaerolineae bacterium]